MTGNTAVDIGAWLVAFFALVGGFNQVLRLVDRVKEKPPPSLTYQPRGDYATRQELAGLVHRHELDALKAELTKTLGSLAAQVEEARHESRQDRTEILRALEEKVVAGHKRTDKVLEAVAELRGRVEQMNQRR